MEGRANRRNRACGLLTLALAFGGSLEALAWGKTVHNNLARLVASGARIERSDQLLDAMIHLHRERLVEGSHEPDDGRTNLFLEMSHRYDAAQRAANAFCAAADTIRQNRAEAIGHLGHSFHYLQDLGDPTSSASRARDTSRTTPAVTSTQATKTGSSRCGPGRP